MSGLDIGIRSASFGDLVCQATLWSMEAQPVTFRCCVIICDLLGKSDGKTGCVLVGLLRTRSFLSYRRNYRLIMILLMFRTSCAR